MLQVGLARAFLSWKMRFLFRPLDRIPLIPLLLFSCSFPLSPDVASGTNLFLLYVRFVLLMEEMRRIGGGP